jgi:hypothetical protein
MKRRRGFVAPRKNAGAVDASTAAAPFASALAPASRSVSTSQISAAASVPASAPAAPLSRAPAAVRKAPAFAMPLKRGGSASASTASSLSQAPKKKNDAPATRHYRVMYTTRSNKKRKVFDDGVLELNGKKAILMDLEGELEHQARSRHE